ncbi:MAG TPA: tetratricopeptide repeat protein, partial [Candidatus Sulfotelmatobacter sp.]|nr:tetratricopeptide repeat protein [Candidatus Sulfotelmatobacter sp.]
IYAGVKMAEKAIEAAEMGSNWEDIGNARLHSALIYREVGDTAQAMQFFQLFFQHLDRYPTLQSKTAHAYYNKGLTHQQRREYREALDCYRLASEDFERIGNRAGVLASLQNSAWVMLVQSRPQEAEPFIAQSESLAGELEIPEYQVTQLIVNAFYERQMRRPERTVALCEEVFQSRRQGATDRHRAEAAWIMADLSLEAERLHEAGIFADWAVAHALEAKDPHLMNLASDVKKRVRAKKSELQLG